MPKIEDLNINNWWTTIALISWAFILAGCASDDSKPEESGQPKEDENFGNLPETNSNNEGCSPVGPQDCYCPNGSMDGRQYCYADGTLSSCACLDLSVESNTDATVFVDPFKDPNKERLCPQLRSMTNCTAETHESSQVPASVLFLVDRSGSMACNPPPLQGSEDCENTATPVDPTQLSKWDIMVDALSNVFDELLTRGSAASIGLTYFSNDNMCGVQSAPNISLQQISNAQVSALKNSLNLTTPSGGTPMVGATILSYAYLHQEATQEPGCKEPCGAYGNRYVVVITDGADSCPEPSRDTDAARCQQAGGCTQFLVQEQAPAARSANIRTFVIGAPGSEPARGYLSELAFVGGTSRTPNCTHNPAGTVGDCHYDMTESQDFAADLSAALGQISSAALSCEFAVPETDIEIKANEVNVQFAPDASSEPICFGYTPGDCETEANGWQFATDENGERDLTRVILCGSACQAVREAQLPKVDIVVGCAPVPG